MGKLNGWDRVRRPILLLLTLSIAMGCNASSGDQSQSVQTSPADNTIMKLLLPTGAEMPAVGYGTWMATGDQLEKALDAALEAGYRHIDTATVYQNEKVIGNVLKRWFDSGKIKRDQIFITTKLPPSGNRASDVEKFLKTSLDDLQLEYIDLYLVHVPFSFKAGDDLHPTDEDGVAQLDTSTDHIAVWKEMEKHFDSGRVKAIGLSNFNKTQIKRVIDNARIPPANLQVETHLYFQQNDLLKFCTEHNITMTAYSPLGSPGFSTKNNDKETAHSSTPPSLLKHPEVIEVAKKHNKTSAQVILRFNVQRGVAVIPKSTNATRIKENINLFDFELTDNEMKDLQKLDRGEEGRIIDFEFFKGLKENHPEYPFK